VLLVIAIASSILIIVYSLLDTLPKIKNFNDARQTLIQQVNDAMDRFTVMFQDYTIDYEEYYNRRAT
jgi:SAM-dependent MidA family methyltransferase